MTANGSEVSTAAGLTSLGVLCRRTSEKPESTPNGRDG